MKTIKLSNIKIKFGDIHPPKDEYLMQLLDKAYKGEAMCYNALIKSAGIKPFSSYKPVISKEFQEYFEQRIKEKDFPMILVYPKGNKFIMSDDYNTYYLYLENGYKEILCTVLGYPEGKYVIKISKPFKYSTPKAVIINKKD